MIRIGVAGYGERIHGVIDNNLRELAPDVRVVGVVDPDEAGVRGRLAECDQRDVIFYKNLDEMVRKGKLDALACGTRCNLHTPYGIEAARYDLPIFMEKPVAINMRQAIALEKAFAKTKCQAVVGFGLRASPLCVLARKYIADGAVGKPIHINAVNYVSYGRVYWEEEYRNFDITQGLFLQKATHDLDYMSYLLDSPIVRVAAMASWGQVFGGDKPAGLVCSKCRQKATCLESPENRKRNGYFGKCKDHKCLFSVDCGSPETGTNEDCSSAIVEFASGAHGVYSQVFFVQRQTSELRGSMISGYDGTVSFDWYKNELTRIRHHSPFAATEQTSTGGAHFGGDIELARDFLRLIQGKKPSHQADMTNAIQSVYACLAAKQSAEKGRFVNVRQVGQA